MLGWLKAVLKAILLVPIAVAAALFAIANRGPVTVAFDLFGRDPPEFTGQAPLYMLLLGAVALGVVLGGAGAWFAQARHRRAERRWRREAEMLRQETERLRSVAALPAKRAA